MILLRLGVLIFVIVGIAFVVTQMVIPLLRDKKMFPLFNKKLSTTSGSLKELNTESEIVDAQFEIAEVATDIATTKKNIKEEKALAKQISNPVLPKPQLKRKKR